MDAGAAIIPKYAKLLVCCRGCTLHGNNSYTTGQTLVNNKRRVVIIPKEGKLLLYI
jgi:hypothetical protein